MNWHDQPMLKWFFSGVAGALGCLEKKPSQFLQCPQHDWQTFRNFITWHRLGPLLLKGIEQGFVAPLPGDGNVALREMVAQGVRRNLWLSAKLFMVCGTLEKAGIPFMVLKGLPLGMSAYGDLGTRLGRDIDILVTQKDYEAVATVLRQLDFIPFEPGLPLQPPLRKQYTSGEVWHCGEVLLDLHWQFSSQGIPFPLDPAKAIQRCEYVVVSGHQIPVLHKTDRILFLGHHAAKHLWLRFFWIADFVALLKQSSPSASAEIIDSARAMGLQRPLGMSLSLAENLFQFQLPAGLLPLKTQWKNQFKWERKWIDFALKDTSYSQKRVLEIPNKRVFNWSLALTDRLDRRVKTGLNLLFKPSLSDVRSFRAPKGLQFLYWVWRPIRLLIRVCRRGKKE